MTQILEIILGMIRIIKMIIGAILLNTAARGYDAGYINTDLNDAILSIINTSPEFTTFITIALVGLWFIIK